MADASIRSGVTGEATSWSPGLAPLGEPLKLRLPERHRITLPMSGA